MGSPAPCPPPERRAHCKPLSLPAIPRPQLAAAPTASSTGPGGTLQPLPSRSVLRQISLEPALPRDLRPHLPETILLAWVTTAAYHPECWSPIHAAQPPSPSDFSDRSLSAQPPPPLLVKHPPGKSLWVHAFVVAVPSSWSVPIPSTSQPTPTSLRLSVTSSRKPSRHLPPPLP